MKQKKQNIMKGFITAFAVLLNICFSSAQAQTPASPYLSYDWAFFELKGKVKSVTIIEQDQYSVTHHFNRTGWLQGEEAGDYGDWENYAPFGYSRDAKGRITGTGNCHFSWIWNGKTVIRENWGHMDQSSSTIYMYNQDGERTGYKDEKGRVHKYKYMARDARGNWTYRTWEHDVHRSQKRKIVYY